MTIWYEFKKLLRNNQNHKQNLLETLKTIENKNHTLSLQNLVVSMSKRIKLIKKPK